MSDTEPVKEMTRDATAEVRAANEKYLNKEVVTPGGLRGICTHIYYSLLGELTCHISSGHRLYGGILVSIISLADTE